MMIRLDQVRRTIAERCAQVGREAAEVQIVVAGKYATAAQLAPLLRLDPGLIIGENQVQAAVEKQAMLSEEFPDARWELIGHLQRNKVATALATFARIQSVDSLRLVERLEGLVTEDLAPYPILLQVNVAGEDSKQGFAPAELPAVVERIVSGGRLALRGLMTMPPWTAEAEANRPYFREMAALRDTLTAQVPEASELSMGTSQDFPVAVEEGATLVRLGRSLFSTD